MMFLKLKAIAVFVLFFIYSFSAHSQSVGLVLSGGGAKGMAHIGLIKALEEQNIPIDYITGTSIGAIVGGLYASGYTPDEMYELFRSEKFKLWSTGKIEKEQVYFFKKHPDNASMIELDLRSKNKKLELKLPTNIIPEAQMDFAFMELFSSINAACNYDFNQLYIPFRCVSTDIYRNRAVVSSKGDLGEAIRGSMTFPLYFKPIKVDGTLLFDGGIINNFPSDVMINDFKPDIIIGHKVAAGLKEPEIDDIVGQLENLVMRPTNYEIPDSLGVLLETQFTDVELLDFDRLPFIYEQGYQTAQKQLAEIKSKIERRVPAAERKAKRAIFRNKMPVLEFQNIQVQGVTDIRQFSYIIQSIKKKKQAFTLKQLKEAYFRLVADNQIKSIRPISRYNYKTGYFDLKLNVETVKELHVEIGANIASNAINQGYAGMRYQFFNNKAYTFHGNLNFGRFYTSSLLGARIDFPSNKPFYFALDGTFNRWNYYRGNTELFFEDVRPLYLIQDDNHFRLSAGFPYGMNRLVEFSVNSINSLNQYYLHYSFGKDDTPDKTRYTGAAFSARVETNTLNDKQFATEGWQRMLTAKFVNGRERTNPGSTSLDMARTSQTSTFLQLQLKMQYYWKINNSLTLGTMFDGVFNNKPAFSNYTATILDAPAFCPTPHSKTMYLESFRANNYIAGGGKIIYNISDDFHLRTEGYYFLPTRNILRLPNQDAKYENFDFSEKNFMGNSTLVYKTPFGPASLGLNYYEKPGTKWYFVFNFGYILFNRKSY